MRTEDLKQLGMRLTQLAEAFDRKGPTQGALLVWLDVLKEFPIFDVESMLVDMPKRLTKFPAPADVWKACNERRSDRIENTAKAEATAHVVRVTEFRADSLAALGNLEKIKEILKRPRPSKRAWVDEIYKHHEDGYHSASGYAIRLAKEAQASFERRSE